MMQVLSLCVSAPEKFTSKHASIGLVPLTETLMLLTASGPQVRSARSNLHARASPV